MKELAKHVLSLLDAEVPQLKFIAEDIGQLEAEKPPVIFPCALFTVNFDRTVNLTPRRQRFEATVVVRVAFDFQNAVHNLQRSANLDRSLSWHDTVASVVRALQSSGEPAFNRFVRTSQVDEATGGGLKVMRITFSTGGVEHLDE